MTQKLISGLAAHIGKHLHIGVLAATLALSGCGAAYLPVEPCITLDEIHVDAYGRDNQFLNGEYVVFGNSCDTPLFLEGWIVEDDDGNHYTFPPRDIGPAGRLCLRSGDGIDSAHNLYWRSNGRPIWNNDRDTVHVFDHLGELVLEYAYDLTAIR